MKRFTTLMLGTALAAALSFAAQAPATPKPSPLSLLLPQSSFSGEMIPKPSLTSAGLPICAVVCTVSLARRNTAED